MTVFSDLEGHVALVTGASRGVGAEIALALARAGARLIIVSRDSTALGRIADRVQAETVARPLAIGCNVASVDDMYRLKEETDRKIAAPTILINAAGVFGPLARFSETDPHEWIQAIEVNTIGTYLTCRLFVPGMLTRGWGRIVNVSSASTLLPPQALDSAYSTSKTALNRLTRHLAIELEGTGVAATVIHPGSASTEMWSEIEQKAAALGSEADAFRDWATRVAVTGGDPVSKAADLVLELVDPTQDGRNGEFCWIDEGLDPPVPSW